MPGPTRFRKKGRSNKNAHASTKSAKDSANSVSTRKPKVNRPKAGTSSFRGGLEGQVQQNLELNSKGVITNPGSNPKGSEAATGGSPQAVKFSRDDALKRAFEVMEQLVEKNVLNRSSLDDWTSNLAANSGNVKCPLCVEEIKLKPFLCCYCQVKLCRPCGQKVVKDWSSICPVCDYHMKHAVRKEVFDTRRQVFSEPAVPDNNKKDFKRIFKDCMRDVSIPVIVKVGIRNTFGLTKHARALQKVHVELKKKRLGTARYYDGRQWYGKFKAITSVKKKRSKVYDENEIALMYFYLDKLGLVDVDVDTVLNRMLVNDQLKQAFGWKLLNSGGQAEGPLISLKDVTKAARDKRNIDSETGKNPFREALFPGPVLPGSFVVVNPSALSCSYAPRKVHYVDYGTEVQIDVVTKIGGVSVPVVGRFPKWCGNRMVTKATNDLIFLLVSNAVYPTPARPGFLNRGINRAYQGSGDSARDRVQECCYAVALRCLSSGRGILANYQTYAKTHYIRFYEPFPELDSVIIEILTSSQWAVHAQNVANEHLSRWKNRRFAEIAAAAKPRRVPVEEVSRKFKRFKTYYKAKTVIGKVACAVVPFVGWSIGLYYSWMDAWTRKFERNNKAMEACEVKFKVPKAVSLDIVPCSKIYIKKLVGSKREMPRMYEGKQGLDGPVRLAVVGENVTDVPEIHDSTTEIYGTHIDVPKFAPLNHAANFYQALRHRVLQEREIDTPTIMNFIKHSKKFIDNLPVFHLVAPQSDNELYEFFCKKYSAKKAARLVRLSKRPVDAKTFKCTGFVKSELYFKDDPKQRQIVNYPESFIAHYSWYFSQLGEHMKKFFDGKQHPCYYASGDTPDTLGELAEEIEEYPRKIDSDVSSWDGSIGAHCFVVEKYFMTKRVTGWPESFHMLLKNWGKTNVRFFGKDGSFVHLVCSHMRDSGHLCTSCFNTLLNFCITTFANKIEPDATDYLLGAMGDDNLGGFRNVISNEAIVETYKLLGMKCEVHTNESINSMTFCSGYFYPVDGKYRWGASPGKVLAKVGVDWWKFGPTMHKRLLLGIAKSMLTVVGHVPIAGAFFRAIVRTGDAKGIVEHKGAVRIEHDNPMRPKGGVVCTPSTDTYLAVAERYGTTAEALETYDRYIEETLDIDMMPVFLADSFFYGLAAYDLGIENEAKCSTVFMEFRDGPEEQEEREKLIGVKSLRQAAASGYQFGAEEDEMLENILPTHAMLHSVFSAAEYTVSGLGVCMHKGYNAIARTFGGHVCTKKIVKSKARKKKVSVVKKAVRMGKKAVRKNKVAIIDAATRYLPMAAGRIGGPMAESLVKMLISHLNAGKLAMGNPMGKLEAGVVTITNKEYLDKIFTSINYSNRVVVINPTNQVSFPWLSGVVQRFAEHSWKGLVFYYDPTSGNALNSTNAALGAVMMAIQYDVSEPAFSDRITLLNYDGAVESKPSEALVCPVSLKNMPTRVKFTDMNSPNVGTDMRLSMVGELNLSTDGAQAIYPAGDLWVGYSIQLYKPRIPPGAFTYNQHFRLRSSGVTAVLPFGSARASGGNLLGTFNSTFTTLTFVGLIPGTRYFLAMCYKGSAAATAITYSDSGFGWVGGYGFNGDSEGAINTAVGTIVVAYMRFMDCTSTTGSITMTVTGAPTLNLDLYFSQFPDENDWPASNILLSQMRYNMENMRTDKPQLNVAQEALKREYKVRQKYESIKLENEVTRELAFHAKSAATFTTLEDLKLKRVFDVVENDYSAYDQDFKDYDPC